MLNPDGCRRYVEEYIGRKLTAAECGEVDGTVFHLERSSPHPHSNYLSRSLEALARSKGWKRDA